MRRRYSHDPPGSFRETKVFGFRGECPGLHARYTDWLSVCLPYAGRRGIINARRSRAESGAARLASLAFRRRHPRAARDGEGQGGRETRPGEGGRPAAAPRARRRRRRRLRRVSLSPPGPPRHVPGGGPEGSGGGGCPVRLPPTPPPVAPATTASPRPADPARRGSSGRVSRAVRRDGRRLPRRGAARPAPSPPAPPALGRSASAGRRRSSRRSGPVARSPGASPRPSGPRGPVPPPPPPPTPPGGSCVSVRVLPPSRRPPRPLGAKLPVGAPAPCPLPSVVVVGGKGARERGRGQGAPPPPVVGGERPGEVRRSRARTGRRVRARRWGKGSAPSRGDGWGRLSGARRGPPGGGRPARGGGPQCVTGRQRRGAGVARGVARRGHGRRGRREGATRRSSRGPWPCAARARAPPASPGEGGNPPGACGVPAPTLARGRRVPRRVKPLPAPPVCCFPSDSAGRRQPPPTSSRLRGGSRRRRDVCRASGGSPAEAKRSTQLVRLLAVDHSALQTRRPPEGSVAAGEIAAREKGEGDRELAPRPLARRAFWGRSPPPRERLLAPQAASGCCRRRGGVGGRGRSRATGWRGPRGGGGGGGRVFRSARPAPPLSPTPAVPPPAAVRPRPVPASRPRPPRLSPRRGGRFAPEAGSACASAPRGRVPRRRPAGRRGVCPPLRALPPGCGRAAVRAPELPPRGRGRGPGEIGGARCVRRPFGLRPPGGFNPAAGPAVPAARRIFPAPRASRPLHPPSLRPSPLSPSASGRAAGGGGGVAGWAGGAGGGAGGGPPPGRRPGAAGRISTAAVRRDRLRDGWEGPAGKVARGGPAAVSRRRRARPPRVLQPRRQQRSPNPGAEGASPRRRALPPPGAPPPAGVPLPRGGVPRGGARRGLFPGGRAAPPTARPLSHPGTPSERTGSAAMSATHPTRLETRTKESNTCASQGLARKPPWRNEGEGRPQPAAEVGSRGLSQSAEGAPPARLARRAGEVEHERTC
ncbi:PREDICTED: basic proline-rich protein-like [Capra hircus]|nr:PREDICTED: basic proline-rich protein-like [Capra hircus]